MGLFLVVLAIRACTWGQNEMGARARAGSWGWWGGGEG